MVETRGHLDKVTIDDGTLTLEGWAGTTVGGQKGDIIDCRAWPLPL